MRISGTEPSSVIPSQTKQFKKLTSDAKKKVPKEAKAKWDGVINPKIQFQSILTQEILMHSIRYESTEVDRRTLQHVLSGTL